MTDAEFASKARRKKAPEDEADDAGELYDFGPAEAGGSSPGAGGRRPQPEPDWSEAFFGLIRGKYLDEAQEFRRKGYNGRVPGVDPGLLPQLRAATKAARCLINLRAPEKGPRGKSWLLEKISELEAFAERLSEDTIQTWVNDALARERLLPGGPGVAQNKSAAQSLAAWLGSTLQVLTRVARALGSVVDYSTPENLRDAVEEELADELTAAIAPDDRESVTQALKRMKADAADSAAWSGLMDISVAARAASRPDTFDAVAAAVRRDADKASKRAGKVPEDAQAFFGKIAAFLLEVSRALKAGGSAAGQETAGDITETTQGDNAVPPRSQEGGEGFSRKLRTRVRQRVTQLRIAKSTVSKYGRVAARAITQGEMRDTPSKPAGRRVADSITRSILWQWQQPAIRLQQASGAILTKVSELKKIRDLFSADVAASAADAAEESGDIPGAEPREDDLDAQVRQWVNERTEQERPAGQRAAKLAVLGQLLEGDIAHARRQVARVGSTTQSTANMLMGQRAAVFGMIYGLRSADLDAALKAVNELLPEIAGRLAGTAVALEEALRAVGRRDFSAAEAQARTAQLGATAARVWIGAESARLTGQDLDENSRGARIARHWAGLARELSSDPWQAPGAVAVRASLKKRGLMEGTLSHDDPEGYLFATRLAGELENASNDELKLPMSPDEYVALEKSLVAFIVNWGQKRVARGGARLVVELSFEQAVDTVTFGLSGLLRVPYKVLKASVKIPYRVNKVNNYTMPGQDRPYRAMYALLGKKLMQLGFNLVTAPVPGVIKLPIGAVSAAGAALYNHQLEAKEKTFSAVYERVAQGRKSEKIKMGSAQGMLFGSLLDAGVIGGAKGVRKEISRAGKGGPEATPRATGVRRMPPAEEGETLTPVSATDALRRIADAGEPELQALASRLLLQPDIDGVPLWQSELSGQSRYNLSGRWIKLGAGASDREILHEITHGLTADKLRYGQAHPGSALGRQVAELDALRRNALAGYQGEDPQTRHYLSNLDEFVAGLFSGNQDFIDHLQALDNKGRSLLQSVIESLCWLLGLLPEQESALSRAMGLTDAIMQAPAVAPEGDVDGELYFSPPKVLYSGNSGQAASPAKQTSGAGRAVDWQNFDGRPVHSAKRDALLSWLAALTLQTRRDWFSSRTFSDNFDKDLNIYLAERHFIYDDMVSGADYFAWVNQFKEWPATFQRDNRVVGILRDDRSPADFPAGKGFLFTLRDDSGGVIFTKKYFPEASVANGNQSGLWHKNILEQIARDMEKLPVDRSVSIANITGYGGCEPALGKGATASKMKNVFITSADSQVATADFRFIDASENIASISDELEEEEEEEEHKISVNAEQGLEEYIESTPTVTDRHADRSGQQPVRQTSEPVRQNTTVTSRGDAAYNSKAMNDEAKYYLYNKELKLLKNFSAYKASQAVPVGSTAHIVPPLDFLKNYEDKSLRDMRIQELNAILAGLTVSQETRDYLARNNQWYDGEKLPDSLRRSLVFSGGEVDRSGDVKISVQQEFDTLKVYPFWPGHKDIENDILINDLKYIELSKKRSYIYYLLTNYDSKNLNTIVNTSSELSLIYRREMFQKSSDELVKELSRLDGEMDAGFDNWDDNAVGAVNREGRFRTSSWVRVYLAKEKHWWPSRENSGSVEEGSYYRIPQSGQLSTEEINYQQLNRGAAVKAVAKFDNQIKNSVILKALGLRDLPSLIAFIRSLKLPEKDLTGLSGESEADSDREQFTYLGDTLTPEDKTLLEKYMNTPFAWVVSYNLNLFLGPMKASLVELEEKVFSMPDSQAEEKKAILDEISRLRRYIKSRESRITGKVTATIMTYVMAWLGGKEGFLSIPDEASVSSFTLWEVVLGKHRETPHLERIVLGPVIAKDIGSRDIETEFNRHVDDAFSGEKRQIPLEHANRKVQQLLTEFTRPASSSEEKGIADAIGHKPNQVSFVDYDSIPVMDALMVTVGVKKYLVFYGDTIEYFEIDRVLTSDKDILVGKSKKPEYLFNARLKNALLQRIPASYLKQSNKDVLNLPFTGITSTRGGMTFPSVEWDSYKNLYRFTPAEKTTGGADPLRSLTENIVNRQRDALKRGQSKTIYSAADDSMDRTWALVDKMIFLANIGLCFAGGGFPAVFGLNPATFKFVATIATDMALSFGPSIYKLNMVHETHDEIDDEWSSVFLASFFFFLGNGVGFRGDIKNNIKKTLEDAVGKDITHLRKNLTKTLRRIMPGADSEKYIDEFIEGFDPAFDLRVISKKMSKNVLSPKELEFKGEIDEFIRGYDQIFTDSVTPGDMLEKLNQNAEKFEKLKSSASHLADAGAAQIAIKKNVTSSLKKVESLTALKADIATIANAVNRSSYADVMAITGLSREQAKMFLKNVKSTNFGTKKFHKMTSIQKEMVIISRLNEELARIVSTKIPLSADLKIRGFYKKLTDFTHIKDWGGHANNLGVVKKIVRKNIDNVAANTNSGRAATGEPEKTGHSKTSPLDVEMLSSSEKSSVKQMNAIPSGEPLRPAGPPVISNGVHRTNKL